MQAGGASVVRAQGMKNEFTLCVNPERAPGPPALTAKILAIQFRSLGDLVLLIPALQAIGNRFPHAELHVLVPDVAAPLLLGQPGLTKVWAMHRTRGQPSWKQSWPLIRSLRAERFDRSVDFGGNDRGAILSFLCGARERLGLDYDGGFLGRRFCYTRRIGPASRNRHETLRSVNVLSAWGILPPPSVEITLHTDPALDPVASQLLPKGTVLCFIGAGMAKKCWPPSHWAAFYRKAAAAGYRLAFAAGIRTAEQVALQEFKRLVAGAMVLPQLDLATFLAVIKRAGAVISNDTGPMHFAATLGVPTIGLFGPTSASQWGPVGKKQRIIEHLNCICNPSSHTCHSGEAHCLASISPDEVFLALQELYPASDPNGSLLRQLVMRKGIKAGVSHPSC